MRLKGTGPKGHYVQKEPARRAIMFKKNRPEGPIRLKGTGHEGPKEHKYYLCQNCQKLLTAGTHLRNVLWTNFDWLDVGI
jgi:hypothetical protein